MEYIVGPKEPGCVFCGAASADAEGDRRNLVLARRPDAFVIMNRFPYSHAHIMVVPARHVSSLEDLPAAEAQAFFDLVLGTQTALRRALKPAGLNLGMNIGKAAGAGIADHVHMHLLPRWDGDTNFMPLIAGVRVVHEHLEATRETLLPFFEQLTEGPVR
jgi:ATP adenylyltransferase